MPDFLKSMRLAYTIGQITIVFYYGAIYTHVLIGLNRYIAISLPFSYTKYFNDRKTVQWIAILWIIAFCQSCAYQFGNLFHNITTFVGRSNARWRRLSLPFL